MRKKKVVVVLLSQEIGTPFQRKTSSTTGLRYRCPTTLGTRTPHWGHGLKRGADISAEALFVTSSTGLFAHAPVQAKRWQKRSTTFSPFGLAKDSKRINPQKLVLSAVLYKQKFQRFGWISPDGLKLVVVLISIRNIFCWWCMCGVL